MTLLLLGNSYTFFNDLDLVLQALLVEAGETDAATTRLAEGGLAFPDHVEHASSDPAWEEALVSGTSPWSWGILQDQSQIPGFYGEDAIWEESAAAGAQLDDWIEVRGGESLLFLTWGRRDGDATNPTLYPDFPTMQDELTEGYLAYRDRFSTPERPVWVAPAGLAFAAVFADTPEPADPEGLFYRLYDNDGSHPSPLGTWLAACVLYSAMSGQSAEGLTPPPSVDPIDGETLAAYAWAVVESGEGGLEYPWQGEPGDDTGSTGDTATTGDSGPHDSGGPTPDTGETVSPGAGDEVGGCGCASGGGERWGLAVSLVAVVWTVRRSATARQAGLR